MAKEPRLLTSRQKARSHGSRLSKERCLFGDGDSKWKSQNNGERATGQAGAQRYLRIIIHIFVNFLF